MTADFAVRSVVHFVGMLRLLDGEVLLWQISRK